MVLEQLDIHVDMNFDFYLISHRKFNLKWIIGLDVKPETIKHLEDSTGKRSVYIQESTI